MPPTLPNATPLLSVLLGVFTLALATRALERWSRWPGIVAGALVPIAVFPLLEVLHANRAFATPGLEQDYVAATFPLLLAAGVLVDGHGRHAHALRAAGLLLVSAGVSALLVGITAGELQAMVPHIEPAGGDDSFFQAEMARVHRDLTTQWAALSAVLAAFVYALVQHVGRKGAPAEVKFDALGGVCSRRVGVVLLATSTVALLSSALLDLAWLDPMRGDHGAEAINLQLLNDLGARYYVDTMFPSVRASAPALRGAFALAGGVSALLVVRELLRPRRVPAPSLPLAALGLAGVLMSLSLKMFPDAVEVERLCTVSRGAVAPACHAVHGAVPTEPVHECALLHPSWVAVSPVVPEAGAGEGLRCAVSNHVNTPRLETFLSCGEAACSVVELSLYRTSARPIGDLQTFVTSAPWYPDADGGAPVAQLVLTREHSVAGFARVIRALQSAGFERARVLVRDDAGVLRTVEFSVSARPGEDVVPRVSLRRDADVSDGARVWFSWPDGHATSAWVERAGTIIDQLLAGQHHARGSGPS